MDCPREGYLEDVAVAEKYRGQKIATHLRDELYAWFREKGVEQVFLRVIDNNPAKKIYEKWGFVTTASNMRSRL